MKTLHMSKEQIELQNGCDEIKRQLGWIQKTITLLNEIKAKPVVVRVECKDDIHKLIKCVYE